MQGLKVFWYMKYLLVEYIYLSEIPTDFTPHIH